MSQADDSLAVKEPLCFMSAGFVGFTEHRDHHLDQRHVKLLHLRNQETV